MKENNRTFREEVIHSFKQAGIMFIIGVIIILLMALVASIVKADNLSNSVYHAYSFDSDSNDAISISRANMNLIGYAYNVPNCLNGTNCYQYNASTLSYMNFSAVQMNHTGMSLSPTGYTYSFWMRLNGTVASETTIFATDYFNCRIFTNYTIGCEDYNGGSNPRVTSNVVINTTNWFNIVTVFNKTHIRIVVNNINGSILGYGSSSSSNTNLRYFGGDANNNRKVGVYMDELVAWNRSLNSSEITTLWNNGQGSLYPYTTPAVSNVNITFVNQTPSALTTTILLSNPLEIYYKFNGSTRINTSPYIESNISNAQIYINGSLVSSQVTKSYTNTTDNINYLFRLFDNDVYPATYNMNETYAENIPHGLYTSSSASSMMKVQLLNVSLNKSYNIFEVMANVNTTGTAIIIYCNSSYNTGNPSSNNNCVTFGSITTSNYSHRHNASSHNVLFVSIVNGSINGVTVTPISYFIITRSLGNVQVGYVNGSVRVNATMTSINTGNTWSDMNYTADLHVHQYAGNEQLNYRACNNITSSIVECSDIITQSIGLAGLPPSSPIVSVNSTINYYNDTLRITWINATPSNNSITINNYNVSIYNSTNEEIFKISTGQNNSVNWVVQGVPYNTEYFVVVTATDSNSLSSRGYSERIEIHNKIVTPCNTSYTMNSSGVNIPFMYLSDNGSLFTQLLGVKDLFSQTLLTNTPQNVTVVGLDGNYTIKFNASYTTTNVEELSNCYIYFCNNDWEQTNQPCIDNLKLVTYNDLNNCAIAYNVPTDNGTYITCTTPPNTDKDLWFIIILSIVWIITVIVTIAYLPIMGILAFIASAGLGYYTYLYFGNPIIGIVCGVISVVAIIAGGIIKR